MPRSEPWRIHFFQRHRSDDPSRSVPAMGFLSDVCPTSVAATMQAVLEAVAEAPPPAYSGGLQWQAMRKEMKGYHEVRVMGPGKRLYRLFCVLERPAPDLGGPSIVAIAGLWKPNNTVISEKDYARVRALGDEFKRRRTVLK